MGRFLILTGREIRDHAGLQFDPEMAEAFITLCADGLLPL